MSAEVYGIYKRVSSKHQSTEDKHSLAEQERLCRGRIATENGVLAEGCIYTDVISGEKLERPALEQCLDDARDKNFTRLIVATVDRFSRDNRLAAYLMVLFDRCGVKVEFLDADDSTEEGRVMLEIRQLFARMEHKRITWRTQTSRRARAKQGKLITGAWPLYGYLWNNPEKGKRDAYIIDPETAPIVVRIFEEVAAGVPIREVVRRLEQEGVPSPGEIIFKRGLWPKGKPHSFFWRRTTMHRMLTNPAYWGEAVAFRYERYSAQRQNEVTGETKTVYAQKVRKVNPELFATEWTEEAGHSAIPLLPEVCHRL